MTEPTEVRHTVFFSSENRKLSAFARAVVDVAAGTICGIPVEFVKLEVDETPIDRRFWCVPEIPDELKDVLRLGKNYIVQGTSLYRIGQPRDDKSLKLLRAAEGVARSELFPERYDTKPQKVSQG